MVLSPRAALVACAVFGLAFPGGNAVAQVPLHADTQLDVSHAWITATIVGCEVKTTDKVLVNGKASDGFNWDNPQTVPAHPTEIPPFAAHLLKIGQHSTPTTLATLSFRLKPDYYRALDVTVGTCSLQPIPLIATDVYSARHITLVAKPKSSQPKPNSVTGLYGGIPLLDVQVWLVGLGTANSYAARNEDNSDVLGPHYMYFFDSVAVGRYKLVVKGFGWERDLGEISLKEPETATFREITAEQLGLTP
jgi:hypothetical protein